MADILTHLRELSFGYGILQNNNSTFQGTPKTFLKYCQEHIVNCEHLTRKQVSQVRDHFLPEEKKTIENGLRLAQYILDKKIITSDTPKIVWLGNQTQSGTPVDIEIDDIPFSLKEESFVLHNMGLYQLINIIIDKVEFKRGLHVFEKYAPDELNTWFNKTREITIQKLKEKSFETKDGTYKNIKLAYSDDLLYMFYNGLENRIKEFSTCDYNRFKKETSGIFREKVFSKFINSILYDNNTYIENKRYCSEVAGENLVNYLMKRLSENPSPKSLYNLFRITKKPYYYAKTTSSFIEVYRVPSQEEFKSKIKITSITSGVPTSQLNLYTTMENIETNEKLIVRNELRYSHGQLNGTPEAKMYIDEGSLLIAYEKV